ncbi:putative Phytocyanin domain, cupredoxin [Helianthus annuus]|nr:putative Phytocyanin domain, cupredoxin [Helianthus annuus]KAJ0531355.1 putative Phytocyanin domain, cupredoxin [Helianthus annuus]KAJ0881267.1 putative Phytocyanin domain, cupredoxin [Helianthus annuus]KAJ0885297.1 putative Phytocyanin domain, cupredoxin [Helianthus annuus]
MQPFYPQIMSSSLTIFFSFFALISFVSAITEYTVGDDMGWRIPAANETELYNVWASRRRFYVGDSLRFRYTYDSLVIVDKFGFYHCDSSKAIRYYNEGDDVIVLYMPGCMYFTSGEAEECKQGLKMAVQVLNSGPKPEFPPPPTFNPPPPPPPPPTFDPPPPPTFDPPPPPPPTFDPPPPPTFNPPPPRIDPPPPTFDPPPPAFDPPEDPDPDYPDPGQDYPDPGPDYPDPGPDYPDPGPDNPDPGMHPVPESSPAPSLSDSVVSFVVFYFVTAFVVGFGLWDLEVFLVFGFLLCVL